MRNKENIKELLNYFQYTEDIPLIINEEAMVADYQQDDGNQSLSIKILSVFGGILASFAFLGFLLITGLFNSEIALMAVGGIFIVGSIWINKQYDKIIMDTVSVSAFIIGMILFGYGCLLLKIDMNILCIIFIIISLGTLRIVQNYIISFVSVLMINGSILTIILLNNAYELIHLYVSFLALTITYIFLKEAKIIASHKTLSKLYNPVKIGLIFSFLIGLIFLGKKGLLPLSPDYIWLSSISLISLIAYLISTLFQVLNISKRQHKIGIEVFAVLTLVPTALAPAISGAVLIIVLSFLINYKTGLVLGMISFIYFISQYYYDLNFTLLTKSILLFSSGLLFIALYLLTHKNLTANEKV